MTDETGERESAVEVEQDRLPTPYESARDMTSAALAMTQERLRDMRQQRSDINEQIKTLVYEETMLQRMMKVNIK